MDVTKKVLIVEDEAFLRTILTAIITSDTRFEVIGHAASGQEAIEKYIELKPDLVTMDIMMPNTDGMAALKKILEYDSTAKVIMITAMGQQKVLEKAFDLGASGFITKPFEETKVLSAVEDALNL